MLVGTRIGNPSGRYWFRTSAPQFVSLEHRDLHIQRETSIDELSILLQESSSRKSVFVYRSLRGAVEEPVDELADIPSVL